MRTQFLHEEGDIRGWGLHRAIARGGRVLRKAHALDDDTADDE